MTKMNNQISDVALCDGLQNEAARVQAMLHVLNEATTGDSILDRAVLCEYTLVMLEHMIQLTDKVMMVRQRLINKEGE